MSEGPYSTAQIPSAPADETRGLISDPDGPIIGAPSKLPILSSTPELLNPLRSRGRLPEWLARVLVVLFAVAIYLPNIGSFGLWDPWETHYGEVTRYMIETGDWVHPWWGYRGPKIGDEKGTGEKFHSKPILLFWMEAATIKAIGLSETAIRLPVALLGILCVFVVYYCFSTLLGQGVGFLSAGVLGTCPLYYFLARQAQTDMPFVANMTIALSFFCLAVFGPRIEPSIRRTWRIFAITWGVILLTFLPQLGIISADIAHDVPSPSGGGEPSFFAIWRYTGWMQAVTWLTLMAIVLVSIVAWFQRQYQQHGTLTAAAQDTLRRRCYLWLFYTFCAIALMGKGLLGFMLPGAIIFVYLLITNEWSLLAQPHKGSVRGRVELLRGIAIFLCIGLPWYVGLLSGPDGKAFWNRFFIHDHFNRLGSG
ncbi:MAG: glycosyltransferase family 39 protein, partial [Myxococcota bacterium]|nr:glycosyltransferase family 39 protein [Myxococcota bacterium]